MTKQEFLYQHEIYNKMSTEERLYRQAYLQYESGCYPGYDVIKEIKEIGFVIIHNNSSGRYCSAHPLNCKKIDCSIDECVKEYNYYIRRKKLERI